MRFRSALNVIHPVAIILLAMTMVGGLFIWVKPAVAQIKANRALYKSQVDELLTVRKIALLPFSDNVGGIYSRPLENHLLKLIDKNHHWVLANINAVGPILTPEDLETNRKRVEQVGMGLDADAFIIAKVTKGPKGISIKLDMFLTKDDRLFAQATLKNHTRFEVDDLKEQITSLFNQVVRKIPYDALVMSRQGTRVTVNLGKRDGIEKGKVVSVIQIIKANRHPKFGFLINTEKEILGKIRLLKVDDTLSFGRIVSEKEKGAIQKNSKISGIDYVNYSDSDSLLSNSTSQDSLLQRPDGQVSFGKGAKAWVPKKPPTFGQVGARLGLGMFNGTKQATQTLEASNPYYPSVFVEGELWLTSQWSVHATLRQGIIPIDNPESGSSPSELSQALGVYEFLGGYNVRMGPSVWGPSVVILAGYSSYRLFVDDSSTSTLTTMTYTGVKTGLRGSFPVTKNKDWHAGAQLFFFFQPRLSESPSASGGGSNNNINQFGLFAVKRLGVNLKALASLDFELYSTTFGSGNTSSSSHKHTTFSAGVYYMF